MSKKSYSLLLCILIWLTACRDVATPLATITPTETTITVTQTPPSPTARLVQTPTDSEIAILEPTQILSVTPLPTPIASSPTPTTSPTSERVEMEPFEIVMQSEPFNTYIDRETRLAIPLEANWEASRHNDQTIVISKTNYYIDIYVTAGLSDTLPTIPVDDDLMVLDPLGVRELGREITQSTLIKDGKRVAYLYIDDGQPLQHQGLSFYAVLYGNDPDEAVDLPNEIVAESAEMISQLWYADAYSAETIPIPTIDPTELWSTHHFTSTNGEWTATNNAFLPVEDGSTGPEPQQHRQLFTVGRVADDQVWRVVDTFEGWGLGVGYYSPLHWQEDKLFFTYTPVVDGCSTGENGSNVFAFDLQSGAVEQLLPTIGQILAFNPAGTRVAVAQQDAVTVYHLSGNQVRYTFGIGSFVPIFLQWTPAGDQLLLAVQDDYCSYDGLKRLYLVDLAERDATLLNGTVDIKTFNQPVWLNEYELVVRDFEGEWLGSYLINIATGEVIPYDDVYDWRRYEDDALNLSVLHASIWTVAHENGTTRFVDADGKVVVGVRDYPDRNGIYSVHELAQRIVPPTFKNTLALTETTIGVNTVYQTNTNLWLVKVEGRYLGVEFDDAEMMETFLRGFSAESLDFQDNYRIVSNDDWIAELRGGVNVTGTFTVQRRDGTDGYTILDIPQTQGLGYTTYEPLLFHNNALYYLSYNVADGCGGDFTVGGTPIRFDLNNGRESRADFSGSGFTIAPDNKTLAYMQREGDAGTFLTVHDLDTDERTRIPYRFNEGQALAGLLLSADLSRIAVATQRADCNELGWSIETIDLSSGEQLTYLWSEERERQFGRPTAWEGDIITLRRFWDSPDEYLNIWTGEISDTPPQPAMERSVREAQELLETHLRVEQIDALHNLIADEFVIGDLHGDRQTVDRNTALRLLNAQTPFRALRLTGRAIR